MQILRSKPRNRNILRNSGRIVATIKVCSEKDGVESYLHIGSGGFSLVQPSVDLRQKDPEEAIRLLSRSIVRDVGEFMKIGGNPVIPGSSVKGNVRSRIELSFIPKEGKVRSCLIRSSPPRREPRVGESGWRHYRIWGEALKADRRACDYTKLQTVCLVCDIFGTAGLAGLVFFGDFVGRNDMITTLSLPNGEKIEVAKPGSQFAGEITFVNLKPEELGLILYGMGIRDSRIGKPVLLGKYKYQRNLLYRFGVVRYIIEKVEYQGFEGSIDDIVRELVSSAVKTFGDELRDVDEVRKLEEI